MSFFPQRNSLCVSCNDSFMHLKVAKVCASPHEIDITLKPTFTASIKQSSYTGSDLTSYESLPSLPLAPDPHPYTQHVSELQANV